MEYMLEMKSITKTFPGVIALDDVDLKITEGDIHAIVGENGAGKSTLMKVLSGVYPHNSYKGKIIFQGEECTFSHIHDSEKKGIAIIHQELALVPLLSIGENIFLGNEQGKKVRIDWDKTYQEADKYLKLVGLNESSHTLIKDIGIGKQQLVEIAKALTKNVKLLILDEPTASLNEQDSKNLLDLLLSFKKQGMTSILISHKLNEIEYVADKVTVIRDGKTITDLNKTEGFDENKIIKAMVGRDISDRFPTRSSKIGKKIFEVKNWKAYHPIYSEKLICNNVNFYVREGEIIGISGLMGAGRTELAMSIYGRSYGKNISGQCFINDKEVDLSTPKKAIANQVAYVTEDRKGNGLILSNSIKENITLSKLDRISKNYKLDEDLETHLAEQYSNEMNVKRSSNDQMVSNLSGGNQQKVLVGKSLFAEPNILFLDEPTRGIDVGAKYEIYNLMNNMVSEGKAVIMISSEMPELLGMCDRIYVMNEGKIVGELSKEEATQEKIMSLIIQSTKENN